MALLMHVVARRLKCSVIRLKISLAAAAAAAAETTRWPRTVSPSAAAAAADGEYEPLTYKLLLILGLCVSWSQRKSRTERPTKGGHLDLSTTSSLSMSQFHTPLLFPALPCIGAATGRGRDRPKQVST